MQVEVGAVLEGRITGITAFGAFVALPGGKSGLIHISEVANAYVRDVREYLTEQQTVRVKVLSVSPEGKISLSLRQAAESGEEKPSRPAPRSQAPARNPGQSQSRPGRHPRAPGEQYVPASSGDQNFEDKLKRFMQESDGKMSGNKLFQQQRKGQRRRK